MIVSDASMVSLLLTNRLVEVDAKPLSAGEFWSLCRAVGDLDQFEHDDAVDVLQRHAVLGVEADRLRSLLQASRSFSFERERLAEEGIQLVSALDRCFPERLRSVLGDACPSFLFVAGDVERLSAPALGVVGSRDASADALDVAAAAARAAAAHGWTVVSGLARGIDQQAMGAALDAGAPVIGIPTEGIRVVGRGAEIRRRVHDGDLCIASPYAPSVRFTAGNAMGRNKIVYALAQCTLVVCADQGTGGTWGGAHEAIRRHYGAVGVWTGAGAGAGNEALVEQGGVPVNNIDDLFGLGASPAAVTPVQNSLFD